MDSEVLYAIFGIVVFSSVAVFILRSGAQPDINTKELTRESIIIAYQKELYEALAPLKNDKKARISKKSELLKKFSDELSRNIFFEKMEVREIILDLAENY